jgi:hypothetical protein
MNLFTPEDLLEYYYQETSPEKTDSIALALENSWALRQKYEVICEAAIRLDKSIISPRPESVQFIMDYAAHGTPASV